MGKTDRAFFHGFRASWRKRIYKLPFVLIPSLAAILHAQDRPIKFERLGMEQGLSQSTVYCILQDHQGFMWFGTQIGLNKYDGYEFTVYKHDVFDSTSLSPGVVGAIYEDHNHTLWVGMWGFGLSRFDREKEQFTHFVHDPKNPQSLSHNRVNAIYEDRSGTLWVGTGDGLNKFDREKKQFIHFVHDVQNPHSLSNNYITAIYEDRAGTFWIGTGDGLNRFDREKEQFTHFVHDPKNSYSLSHNLVRTIYEDASRTLWIGTEDGGLNKFDHGTEQFTRFSYNTQNPQSLIDNQVQTIFEDHAGMLWIGTRIGLNRFDREKAQFNRFLHDPQNLQSLGDNNIMSIYEDRAGILWIGTFFGGLAKFDREKEQFISFVNDRNNPRSLIHNVVNSFCQDHTGTLWVGTIGGLSRLNLNERGARQFSHFFNDPKNPRSLSDNNIRQIIEDRTGTLWIGTLVGGLNRFDRDAGQFTRFLHDPKDSNSLSHNTIWSIYEDSASPNTLWIGTRGGGLNKFDREKRQFTRFVNNPKNPQSLSNNAIWAICEDSNAPNALWIATSGGLNHFDHKTGQFTRFVHDPKNPHSLSQNIVFALCEDSILPGVLWVGTQNGGLNRFDCNLEQFTAYTEKDGLQDNVICGILADNRGRLWLSTNNGLSRFDPQTKIFRNYNIADGVPYKEFMTGAYYKNKSGEMFFGSFNGFITFHPDSIKDNPYIPPIVITAFKRYNTDDAEGVAIEEKGISAKKEVEVSYKDNVLSFEFAALSYRNTFKNQYAYKLEGFNDNWIRLGTKRDLTFTNLDPGEYMLRVKGSNNDGVWNEEGASLKITITPPWWRTRWAYAFYVLLFTALLYGWRRFELNRVKLRNELKMKNFEAQKLQEIDQMKSRFFANISHEFRTPLTLIAGPVEQMRTGEFRGNVQEAYEMILRNSRRLLRLINQLLDLAKLEAGSMSLQARPENMVSFLKGLVLSFASAAERKRIALSISAEEENLVVYFDRDKLEKIVSNLLSNALKFTPEDGRVEVWISTVETTGPVVSTSECVEIAVTDTGAGIPADQLDKIFDRFYQVDASQTREHEGTGIGLALTKELVELHHGEIFVQSEVGQGTTFIVRLPLGKAHLKPEGIASDQLSVTNDQFAKEDRTSSIEDRAISDQQQVTSNESKRSEDPDLSGQQVDETIVLVVEDNRDVRAYVRQYLEPAFKVVEAIDGFDGVDKAVEMVPDLIISDVMMPKRDGNELCRMLKTDERTSHVPIIMLTAKADRESKVQGLEIGADDYLIKPFDSRELLARVNNLIRQRQQLRERFSREVVLKPQDIAITPMDEVFLNKVKAVVEKHLSDEDFDVETLSREVGMSRMNVHRKLKALTNQPASQFIRSMRLQRAVELLKQNAGTVAEIAYAVGFGSQAYFTKCFHEQFGCAPKEYAQKNF